MAAMAVPIMNIEEKKQDIVNAFACLNYAHGWLDCGARLGIFKVADNRLFVVD